MSKPKKKVFSVTKAVKQNARAACWGRNDVSQATPPATALFRSIAASGDRA